AELAEMFVESEGGANTQSLHNHSAHAVGKAPILVAEIAVNSPGFAHVSGRNPFQAGDRLIHKRLADMYRTTVLAPNLHQSEEFIHDVVGCDERLRVSDHPSVGCRVIGIIGYEGREPSAGVHEDHARSPYSNRSWSRPVKPSAGFST